MTHSRRTIGILIVASIAWGMGNDVQAHEFEDGFVERSVSFVIRDRHLVVEYSVGLNPETMRQHLIEWGVAIPKLEKQPVKTVRPATIGSKNPRTARSKQFEQLPEENLESELKIEQLFRDEVGKQLNSKLEILVDGKPVKLRLAATDISSRHHVNATSRFEFEFVGTGAVAFSAQDRNFLDQKGGVRYSLKSLGSTMLQSSNVEPVLIRAERIEVGKLKKESREKYTRVLAKLVIVPSKEDAGSSKKQKSSIQ